jgi:hypothetical protein
LAHPVNKAEKLAGIFVLGILMGNRLKSDGLGQTLSHGLPIKRNQHLVNGKGLPRLMGKGTHHNHRQAPPRNRAMNAISKRFITNIDFIAPNLCACSRL